MERFLEIISDHTTLQIEDEAMIVEIAKYYPWFIPAKILLMKLYLKSGDTINYERIKNALALRIINYPVGNIVLDAPDVSTFKRLSSFSIIEDFLADNSHKIIPDQAKYNGVTDISKESIEDNEDELISESLAEIYLKQGLNNKALQIYRKLSLKFPEKSVYFAKIITEITETKDKNK